MRVGNFVNSYVSWDFNSGKGGMYAGNRKSVKRRYHDP